MRLQIWLWKKRDRSQTRWRIPENRERIRWPDPPPQNHNPGFSFGFMKEYPKLVEMVPVCMLSAVAGAWAYVIGKKGRVLEKTALTLVLAGGASNLYDRLKRGYVVDYFSIQWKKLKKWSSTWVISLFLPDRPCLRQSSSWRSSAKFFRKKKSLLRKKSNSGSRT